MKHGKALTKKQRILLKEKHLNPNEWLIERNTSTETVFVARFGNRKISIHKERAI